MVTQEGREDEVEPSCQWKKKWRKNTLAFATWSQHSQKITNDIFTVSNTFIDGELPKTKAVFFSNVHSFSYDDQMEHAFANVEPKVHSRTSLQPKKQVYAASNTWMFC